MSVEPTIHPFPGLRPFQVDEEHLFFGREGQSEEILRLLRQRRFLAVVGASGSGKSSLIHAGLLPYLHGGFLADTGSHWRVAIFRPGADPIKNLAAALDDPTVLGKPAENTDAAAQNSILLEVSLRRSGLGLIEAVRLARLPEQDQVLIVIDQFEELFRFAGATDRPGQDQDAAAFVKLLLEASRQRELPIYVVLTMRSDYIGDCARYRDLPEAVATGLYLIPRMTREQRRSAIVEPVRVGGGSIAPRLVVRLLNDVGDDPDQLPILQHALMRTWNYWKANGGGQRPIDVDDYLAVGGMTDALSQHADEAYDGLPDEPHRTIAKRIFQALSEKGPDNREARRPTALGKLAQVVDASLADIIGVVDDFRAPGRSFLMPTRDVPLDAETVIDIAHESLIRGWRRMRQWVEDEVESARVYRRLAETTSLHSQRTAGLLRDPDLENVLAWRDKEHPNAAWGHRYQPGFERAMAFLEQSRLARESERRQRQSTRRRVQLLSSAATAVITIVAVVALWKWHEAATESDRAQQALNTAAQQRDRAQQALNTAAQERDRAQHALDITTKTANLLVFDLGQDPRIKAMPSEMLTRLFDEAIKGYGQVIEINPTADAYNGRGAAYDDKGDFDNAIADYGRAIALDPKDAAAYNNRGIAYRGKGDFDHAIADYDQAITLNPKYANAYRGRGIAHRAKRDFDHAIADYDQAITLEPKNADAYRGRGIAYRAKRDFDHAIADYDQAITLDPKNADSYYDRGNAYLAKGDLDHAIADYDQAITLNPKDSDAYNNRGDAYRGKGDFDHAIADYDQAITLNPKYANAYRGRGIAHRAKRDFDHAIADYDQAITLDPKNADAYRGRGIAYRAKRDFDHAIADYDQAITLDPKNADSYYDRGNAYLAKGDLDHAIADYDQAITLDPKDSDAYSNRGDAYRGKGDFDHAIADYDQAITLDPKNAAAYRGRGIAYRAKRDFDHAIADYDQAITLDPKNAELYYDRGNAYRAKGDFDHAIADYDQAITLDPKNADAYDRRGDTYLARGNYDLATAEYNQAITLDPKDAWALLSRGIANFYAVSPAKALADIQHATEIDPKFAYYALWLDIAAKRSKLPSRLADATARIDMAKWPAPIIRLYLGQLTPAQVLAAADDPDAYTKKGQVCEANFYSGELALQQGATAEAARLFGFAAADCPKWFSEWPAANAELRTLDGTRPK